MQLKRNSLFYIITLAAVGAVMVMVLQWGASLPVPEGVPAVAKAPSTAVHAASANALDAMWHGIAGHFQSPLAHLFVQLLVIIAASRVMGKVFTLLGQPSVIGEMAAGILLGPSLFGAVAPDAFAVVFPASSMESLKLLSQVGVCLFMFAVGMELEIGHVRSKAQTAVLVSHASIVFPALLGVILAYFLYSNLAAPGAKFTAFALFMGVSMSITAFPVLARIMQERGMTKTRLGGTAITCAAIGDVTAWNFLAFVVAFAQSTGVAGTVLNLLLLVLFMVVMIFVVRPGLPRWIGAARLGKDEPSGGVLATILCVVVAAALFTEVIGIHALFGAFLAGAIMPDTHGFRHKIAVRVEKFSSVLLLPLFFAFIGLRTQLGLLNDWAGWLVCLVIIVVATLGKLGGTACAARFAGMNWRESLQLGALMNTRGLMELIALNIGYDMGILSPRIFTMMVIMALATTLLTGPLLSFFGNRGKAPDGASLGTTS
ncbi:cation:proton antiporter [Roseimicrobium gellanilyticum]|uniref:cation:proton antiporter n=1 Tax=Roseimicrobium gellanilyticum TaxID=748857 RepID=UPI001FE59BAF|nr:cation:proton antiporter [Roseimicrobium gellanilyticum]